MLNLSHKDLIVIDIETTGINPFSHDVIAIGLVPVDKNLPSKKIYIRHRNINWSSYAYKNFERFSSDWARHAVEPNFACMEMENYLEKTFCGRLATPVGHNIGFDIAFLKRLAFQGEREQIAGISHRAVDTHTLLFLLNLECKIPDTAITSDGAFDYFGISLDDSERHTAIGDAEATSKLFKCVLAKFAE